MTPNVIEPAEREGVEVEVVEGNPVDVLHDESREAAIVVDVIAAGPKVP